MLAVLRAETAQFEARMTAASQHINRFTGTTASAGRGVNLMRGAIQQLAFQAAGVSGPIGKLASGLLTIGAGGRAALLAAAGIGVAALAIRGLGAAARETARLNNELNASLDKLGQHGEMVGNRRRIAELERLRDHPTFGERAKVLSGGLLRPFTSASSLLTEERERINREIAGIKSEQGRLGAGIEEPARRAERESILDMGRARARDTWLGYGGRTAPSSDTRVQEQVELVGVKTALEREAAARRRAARELELTTDVMVAVRRLGEEAVMRRRMIGAPALAILEDLRRGELLRSGVAGEDAIRVARQERRAASSMQWTDILRNQVPSAILQTISGAQQGGVRGAAASFFPAAAGIASMAPGVGPFAGMAITGLGAIIGGLFNSGQDKRQEQAERAADRRHRELMRILQDTEPVIVSVRSTDWSDPREMDLLAKAIADARGRRALSEV